MSLRKKKIYKIIMKEFTLFLTITVFIIISQNAFTQWTLQGTLTGVGTIPSISVYAPAELVVAGGTSGVPKVFKSTNSGVNWTNISGNLTGPELSCVWAVNANLIFAGDVGSNGGSGGNARVWKTTNGGVNWVVILTTGGSHGYFNGIVFSRTNSLIGVAESDPPSLYGQHYLAKTTDGGNSWNTQTTISTNGTAITGSVVCTDNLFYGWGIYPPARVVITSDGGATWNQRNISGGYNTTGLAFNSDKLTGIGVSGGFLPSISRTTDGGVSWTPLNTGLPLTGYFNGRVKWVYGTNTCYLTSESGSSGSVGKSTDGGLSWSLMNTSGVQGLMNVDLVYINGVVSAYAISDDGRVIKLSEPIGIVPISSTMPSEYNLKQNFPNPFNPVTKIRFSIPQVSSAAQTFLSVYDILGKEVATLVNEHLNAGTYEVDWNASTNPSGVYYYKLTTGNYTETKKMILIK